MKNIKNGNTEKVERVEGLNNADAIISTEGEMDDMLQCCKSIYFASKEEEQRRTR